jgi:uncharacterized protein (TIGR00730 family)
MDSENKKQADGKPLNKLVTFKEIDEAINEKVEVIGEEFRDGFNFIKKHPRSVTIFGSARTPEGDTDYIAARNLGKRIADELNYSVVTGGAIGIMEAGNRGAFEAGGQSVGFNIELPHEQHKNDYLTDYMNFHYFFSRKVCLSFSAEAYIYFPGGFGTMDELFEIMTLVQTGKIAKVPIILVGSYFWNNLDAFIKENLLKNGKISEGDTDLYTITDNEDEIIEIIKNAPIREGVK